MKYLVAIVYYAVIGAAILLLAIWIFPSSWYEVKIPVLVGGSTMLILFVIGVVRGIIYENKELAKQMEVQDEDTTLISEYLAEARDRAMEINAPSAVIVELSQAYADLKRESYFTKEKARARLDLINQVLIYNRVRDEELSDIIGNCYQCLWDCNLNE